MNHALLTAALVRDAKLRVAQYPQYKGHFDTYRLARMRRNVRTKMGLAFVIDEYVIADPQVRADGCICAWSRANHVDTIIRPADLMFVTAP